MLEIDNLTACSFATKAALLSAVIVSRALFASRLVAGQRYQEHGYRALWDYRKRSPSPNVLR